jgi:serine/threonine-protein kinase
MRSLDSLAEHWLLLDSLLNQALSLPASDRQSWLNHLPDDAAGLRDTLHALLAAHAEVETSDFLDTLPKFAPGDAAIERLLSSDASAGDLVGPYRLLELLGRGGMGDVWLAKRADGELKRPVALKLPRVAWGGALAQRLRRERDILATLTHPNIARLYDTGVDAQGRPFLALEYVEGQPIDAYCRERGVPLGERLRLLLQVAAAVAHAHARLVVHRDLKPSNILVTADGQVRLLDFGIAKLMQDDLAEETQLTQVSGRLLTLDYASPEQIRGEPLGTSSDVYSLAVVAYELLAGTPPYRLKRGSAAELEEAISAIDAPLASESAADPGVRKQLRGDLDAVLHQALKKDPAERYPTVVAFADDLQRHLTGHAVLARPDSRLYRARKLLHRHGVAIAVASAMVTALAVGLGVALWQSNEARLQAQRAQRSADRESAVSTLYLETLTTVAGWDAATFAAPNAVPRAMAHKLVELEQRLQHAPDQLIALLDVAATQLPYMGDFDGGLAINQRLVRTLQATGHARSAVDRAAPGGAHAAGRQPLRRVRNGFASRAGGTRDVVGAGRSARARMGRPGLRPALSRQTQGGKTGPQ